MGVDKAFLELDSQTLLARAIAVAAQVTQRVGLLGDQNKLGPFGTVVEDIYAGRGPLGGIHAALMNTATDLNLMLAVDLPFVGVEFLRYLISQSQGSNAVVTVPRAGGVFQPLCAVYRKDFAEVAGRSLQGGQNKIGALFGEVHTRVIEEDELTNAGFTIKIFRNLNTRQDWEEAKQDFGKSS